MSLVIAPNPLRELKNLSSMSWEEMKARTSISVPQLVRLSKKTPMQMQAIQLSTALHLKLKLNIDLIKYVTQHVFPEIIKRETE